MNNAPAISTTVHHQVTDEKLRSIQHLRYRVYAEDMQLRLASMDHDRKLMLDTLDEPAIHICAQTVAICAQTGAGKAPGSLVGAVRLNCNVVPLALEASLKAHSLPKPFIYCSRLFILPEWRGSEVMNRLTRACFHEFTVQHAAVAVCHCYAHLANLYGRMGFRPYGAPFAIPGLEELGLQTPMLCAVTQRHNVVAA